MKFPSLVDTPNRSENGGAFRLRINTRQGLPTEPVIVAPTLDAGSSFSSAISATGEQGDLLSGATVIDAAIEAQEFPLNLPGANNEPGMRDLPDQPHFSIDPPEDVTHGITSIASAFQ